MDTLEQRMIYAHKEGIALNKFCMRLDEVEKIARDRFGLNSDEHDAMLAGFLGNEMRTKATYAETFRKLVNDPATSYWLVDALRALDKRDAVDAVADAALLAEMMHRRLDELC